VNSATISDSVHIYADPDTYNVVSGGVEITDEVQQRQLNPSHIAIDVIVQRGIYQCNFCMQ